MKIAGSLALVTLVVHSYSGIAQKGSFDVGLNFAPAIHFTQHLDTIISVSTEISWQASTELAYSIGENTRLGTGVTVSRINYSADFPEVRSRVVNNFGTTKSYTVTLSSDKLAYYVGFPLFITHRIANSFQGVGIRARLNLLTSFMTYALTDVKSRSSSTRIPAYLEGVTMLFSLGAGPEINLSKKLQLVIEPTVGVYLMNLSPLFNNFPQAVQLNFGLVHGL